MIRLEQRLRGAAGEIDLFFTDAVAPAVGGGVAARAADPASNASVNPYGGFNLGAHVGDDPHAVEENRRALAERVGVARSDLHFMHQVHGNRIRVLGDETRDEGETGGGSGAQDPADGIVTALPGAALVVLVADCTPVLLTDPDTGLIGAVHAGRPGMVAGVVPAAVERMRALGARDLIAVVGPSVCGRCYEVPAAMRDEVAAVAPSSRAITSTGTPAVDVASGVVEQLAGLGVRTTWVPGCTREDPDLYSYRRDHRTGRFAGVIVRRDPSSAKERS